MENSPPDDSDNTDGCGDDNDECPVCAATKRIDEFVFQQLNDVARYVPEEEHGKLAEYFAEVMDRCAASLRMAAAFLEKEVQTKH